MKQKNGNKNKNSCKRRQKWCDEKCHSLVKNLRNIGSLLSKIQTIFTCTTSFLQKKKEYKQRIKKQKRQFHNTILNKIEQSAENNPKEFWKLVNSIKAQKTGTACEIPPSKWFEYFKNLNRINLDNKERAMKRNL